MHRCASLTAEIYRGLYWVVAGVNDYTEEQLRAFAFEARGWFTIVQPDGAYRDETIL